MRKKLKLTLLNTISFSTDPLNVGVDAVLFLPIGLNGKNFNSTNNSSTSGDHIEMNIKFLYWCFITVSRLALNGCHAVRNELADLFLKMIEYSISTYEMCSVI